MRARSTRRHVFLPAIALFSLSAACSSSGSSSAPTTSPVEHACDPLEPAPIALGAVIGVGADTEGVLYVDAETGVYVSREGTLIRQHVIGTGISGTNEYLFSFEPPDGDLATARNLLVELGGAAARAMAVGPADSKAFLDQSPPGITMLSLVEPSTVADMPIVGTPNVIDYVGDVENGDVLMATRPMNPQDGGGIAGGLAIFYGPPSQVAQRAITDYQQAFSGGGTVTFLVDGTPYVLRFGMSAEPDAGPLGTFTLQGLTPEGGATMNVTLRSPTPTSRPPALSFTCLP